MEGFVPLQLFLQCLSALADNSVPAARWVCLAGALCGAHAGGGAGWRKSSATSHQCQAMAFCWTPAASVGLEMGFSGLCNGAGGGVLLLGWFFKEQSLPACSHYSLSIIHEVGVSSHAPTEGLQRGSILS